MSYSSKPRIRGPYPSTPISTGIQEYYVEDGLTEPRKVTLHLSELVIDRANCSCTPLASLQNRCSHIQSLLAFRESSTPDRITSKGNISSTPLGNQKATIGPKSDGEEEFVPPSSVSSFAQIADSVLQAIRDEIHEIQTTPNAKQVKLLHGMLRGSIAGNFKYKFELDDDFRMPADTPIELHIENSTRVVAGTIANCEPDKSVEIALSKFEGEIIPEAVLESRLDFIWERAGERLEKFRQSNPGLVNSFFTLSPANRYNCDLHEEWGDGKSPDVQQQQALEMALRQQVTFVHGPPGTGKSVTIGWLVKELVHRGEHILIASHTNIAVDNALEKALSNENVRALVENGNIVRLGEPLNREIECLKLPSVIARRTASLQRELANLQEKRAAAALELNTGDEEKRILIEQRSIVNSYTTLARQVRLADDRIMKLRSIEDFARASLERLDKQTRLDSLSALVLWIPRTAQRYETKARLNQIKIDLVRAQNEKEDASRQLAKAESQQQSANLPNNLAEIDEQLALISKKEELLRKIVADLDRGMQVIQQKVDVIAEEILSNIQIIGATLSKVCIENALEKFNCDTLIIDELSTAPFPLVLVALGLPTKRVVFFGDPKQLPPINTATTPVAKYWLGRDTYELIPQHENVQIRLTEQRRMPPSVVELINDRMYEGELNTPKETRGKRAIDLMNPPFAGGNVIFVDTSSVNPWCARDTSLSRYNLYSAEIAVEIIGQELRDAIKKGTVETVGVICPYRAQKKLIKRLCETRFRDSVHNFIGFYTVDAFQGRETDVIMVDLTAGPPELPGIRLSEEFERLKNPGQRKTSKVSRLLNVAVTRTKKKLIIIANRQYFCNKLAGNEFVLELIDRATGQRVSNQRTQRIQERKEDGYIWIDGEDFLHNPQGAANRESRFLDQTAYYIRLRQDLVRCSRSVVIVSPFVSRNRVEDLRPAIQSAISRGVKVTVITRPIAETEFGSDAIALLESWGCAVTRRSKTHEKIVFIDDCIAYYGSLNTLSHKDTNELMYRFEGEEVINLISQFLGTVRTTPKTRPRKAGPGTSEKWLTREECAKKLKHIRIKIGTQRHIPFYATLYNLTIESLLDNPPETEEELFEKLQDCGERQLKHLAPFLDEILSVLRRYKT